MTKKINHPSLTFNQSTVSQITSQKHLGVILDSSLSFDEHLISVQSKINKTIGLLCKLQNTLPRQALITINKAFVRPHLDYGTILYNQAYIVSFHQKVEKIQYSACKAITRAFRGTSKEIIQPELGLECLESRRWLRKLGFFFKTKKKVTGLSIYNNSTKKVIIHYEKIKRNSAKHNFSKNLFFPSAAIEWNNLNQDFRNTESCTLFRSSILKFIRPSPNSFYNLRILWA